MHQPQGCYIAIVDRRNERVDFWSKTEAINVKYI